MTPMTDAPTDTSDTPITAQPLKWEDRIKSFTGDMARPYALIAIATAVAKAIWFGSTEALITAAGGTLVLLYGAKAAEVAVKSHNDAKVSVAQATAPSSLGQPPAV
jgi:hypothetical protein